MKRKEVEKMLKDNCLELIYLQRNSHWKARVRCPDGRELSVIFPTSTSDHRALKNKVAQLRNIVAGVG